MQKNKGRGAGQAGLRRWDSLLRGWGSHGGTVSRGGSGSALDMERPLWGYIRMEGEAGVRVQEEKNKSRGGPKAGAWEQGVIRQKKWLWGSQDERSEAKSQDDRAWGGRGP